MPTWVHFSHQARTALPEHKCDLQGFLSKKKNKICPSHSVRLSLVYLSLVAHATDIQLHGQIIKRWGINDTCHVLKVHIMSVL